MHHNYYLLVCTGLIFRLCQKLAARVKLFSNMSNFIQITPHDRGYYAVYYTFGIFFISLLFLK